MPVTRSFAKPFPKTKSDSALGKIIMESTDQSARRPPESSQTRLPRCGHTGGGVNTIVKAVSDRRKFFLKIRVTDAERKAIKQLADSEGGISAYIRRRLPEGGKQEACREIAYLSRHLSLMARATREYPPNRAVELVAWLMVVERLLQSAIRKLSRKRS